jgi:hypothetical protein
MKASHRLVAVLTFAALIPAAATGVVTCTPSPGDPFTVALTATGEITEFIIATEDNATIDGGTCDDSFPYSSCELTATVDGPGPATVAVNVREDGGLSLCGPFTRDDGLPVELVEFSVE